MSPYRVAINSLSETIATRGGSFRNLVVFVVLLSLSVVVWSLVASAPQPLAALTLLVPACGLFAYRDARLVGRWRAEVLHAWMNGTLEIGALRGAIEALPSLPPDTVRSMLDTLPCADDPFEDGVASGTTREATRRVAEVIHFSCLHVVALRSTCFGIMACAVGAAFVAGAWQPLVGLLAPLAERVVRSRIIRRQLGRIEQIAIAAHTEEDFQLEHFVELAGSLRWDPVLAERRDHLLALLRRTPSK